MKRTVKFYGTTVWRSFGTISPRWRSTRGLPHCSIEIQGRVLTIQVPSQFFYEYLEDKYLDLIQQTLYREIGQGTILNYRILVETESNTAVEMRGELSLYPA